MIIHKLHKKTLRIFAGQILFIVFLFLIPHTCYSQFYYFNEPVANIDIEFVKPKIELINKSSFFNILTIINNSETAQNYNIGFTVPEGWNFFGDQNIQIKIGAHDTIRLPIRVAIANDVKGDIGYPVVATVFDDNGKIVKSEQIFVNIARLSNIRFKNLSRTEYFDQSTGLASFKLKIENHGNADELIYLDFTTDPAVQMPGAYKNILATDFSLKPYSDTLLEYNVAIDQANFALKSIYKINIKASFQDTVISSTVWFKKLTSEYVNIVPESKKMLVVEAAIQNLFSEFPPVYFGLISGSLLLKKNRDVSYYYRNFFSKGSASLFERSKTYVAYNASNFTLKAGDVASSQGGIGIYGRGAELQYNQKRHQFNSVYAKTPSSPIYGYGVGYKVAVSNILKFGIGLAQRKDEIRNIESTVGAFSSGIRLLKAHNLSASVTMTQDYYKQDNPYTKYGQNYYLTYSGVIGKLRMNALSRFGSKGYIGLNSGQDEIRARASYLVAKNYIALNYIKTHYSPPVYIGDSLVSNYYTLYEITSIDYSFRVTPQISLYLSPLYENRKANTFKPIPENESFGNRYYALKVNVKYRASNGFTTMGATVRYGLNNVYSFSPIYNEVVFENTKQDPYTSALFSVNLRSRYMGFYLHYYYGPNSLNQHFTYFYNNYSPRVIRLMPFFEKNIYKDIVKLSSRANWVSNITGNSNRLNFTAELSADLSKDIFVSFLGVFSHQSTYDPVYDERYRYSSTYFELKGKKEFGFKQSRLKFCNLNLVFYRDLDGNGQKDNNEPGVKNVLVNFVRDESADIVHAKDYEYQGEFDNVDLLSGQRGLCRYENIPEGTYQIKFYPLDKDNGTYNVKTNVLDIKLDKDKTIFVPFIENNKIFGQIIMNRSKLTNLGVVDISNVKVAATDPYGKVISTLSDANGKFMLYVPNVDKYIVTINNIFYENFNLQQNNYEVQLNGYKQFEITFIFNEKRRKIRFSTEYELDQRMEVMGVEIIRRTNLKGTIKDATTQRPVMAEIKIIDKENNAITKTRSDLNSGVYNLSFLAGENYRIIVSADDYWFYAEKLYERQITTFQNIRKDVLLKRITVGQIIPLNKLLFEGNKADLMSEATAELDRLLEVLRNNQTVRIFINGHADDLEVLDVGEEIATERAKMVARYLIANGYSRVEYTGHGNTMPVAPNDTEANRAKNRRVEIVVKSK